MFSICGRSAIIKGGKDIKENDLNQDLYDSNYNNINQQLNKIHNKEFRQKISEILSKPMQNIKTKPILLTIQQQVAHPKNIKSSINIRASNNMSASDSDIFVSQNKQPPITDSQFSPDEKLQNSVQTQGQSQINNNYALSAVDDHSKVAISGYKPVIGTTYGIMKSQATENMMSSSSEFYSQKNNNQQQGVSRVHFHSSVEELNSQSNAYQDQKQQDQSVYQEQNNQINMNKQPRFQDNLSIGQSSQSDVYSSQVQDISNNMEQLQKHLDQQRIDNGKNLLHYAKQNSLNDNQTNGQLPPFVQLTQQNINATPQTAQHISANVTSQYDNPSGHIGQTIDNSVLPSVQHMSGSQIGNFVLQSNDSFQTPSQPIIDQGSQATSFKQNVLQYQEPVQNVNPIPSGTFVNQNIQPQQSRQVFMKQPQPFQPNGNAQQYDYINSMPPVQKHNIFQQQDNQIYSNQVSNQVTEQLVNSHISLVSPNQIYQQLPLQSDQFQEQYDPQIHSKHQYQPSKYDIEISELKNQVMTQQQLFQQQMQLIKLQQQKILEQQNRDENMKKEIDSLKSQLSKQVSQLISQQKQPRPIENVTHHKITNTYKDVRLSLTNNSLVGFRGQEKLFDVNLSQKNIVQFIPDTNSIIINLSLGSISIKMDSSETYQKWFNDINTCIQNAKEHSGTSNGLTMRLDDVEKKLYVYKSSDHLPSKIFNVEYCKVFVTLDGNNGSIKVKCKDGKKFSFTDKITVIDSWVAKFQRCGGVVQYQ